MNTADRRIVVAHNPHSSRARLVEKRVFRRLKEAGISYVTVQVQQAPLANNVTRLKKEFQAGDIVLCAAGDGSAHAVAHSILAAKKENIAVGFLAFGNFNDLPKSFNSRKSQRDPLAFLAAAKECTVRPITLRVNQKPLRSALLYATIGWTAKAAARFDDPRVRHKVKSGHAGVLRSVWRLGIYYLTSRRSSMLPPLRLNGEDHTKLTDVLLVNGPTLARLFKTGRQFYNKSTFFVRTLNVRWLTPNIPFLIGGLIGWMRGDDMDRATVMFDAPTSVQVQCDGEVVMLDKVTRIDAGKTKASLHVLTDK